jgi:hypothetical protein
MRGNRKPTVQRAGAWSELGPAASPSLTSWAFRAQHDIVEIRPALVGELSSRMQHFVGQASIAARRLEPGVSASRDR